MFCHEETFWIFCLLLDTYICALVEYLQNFVFRVQKGIFKENYSYVDGKHLCFKKLVNLNQIEVKGVRNIHHNGTTGRLGNLMFSYASVKGIAYLTNRTSSFAPPFTDLYTAFPNLTMIIQENHAKNGVTNNNSYFRLQQNGSFSFELERLITGLPPVDVEICCWLQSWKYFSCIDKQIRQEFMLKNVYSRMTSKYFRTVEEMVTRIGKMSDTKGINFVGVHIRVADIHKAKRRDRGFRIAPVHYINAAMDYFRERYSNAQFMLCTDDKEWVYEHIGVMKRDIHLIDTGLCKISLVSLTIA